MKKYLKILPLILYPYAYLLFLVFVFFIGKLVSERSAAVDIFSAIGMTAAVLYNLWVLILVLWSAIGGLKRYTPAEAAKMNLAVKALQIPAYLFHFLMGMAGMVMSIWGIGFITLAVIIDLVTIFLSGLFAIGSVRRLKKEGILSSGTAFLAGLGSFLYCVDVIAAIVLVVIGTAKERSAAPPSCALQKPAPAPSETAPQNAANFPQRKKWRKTSEMPLPPPLPSAAPKPAPEEKAEG